MPASKAQVEAINEALWNQDAIKASTWDVWVRRDDGSMKLMTTVAEFEAAFFRPAMDAAERKAYVLNFLKLPSAIPAPAGLKRGLRKKYG